MAESVGARALYLGYRAGSGVARRVPERVGSRVVPRLGRVLGFAMTERRRQVERNLHRVCGPQLRGAALHRMVNQVFESYARYWNELFRLPDMARGDLEPLTEVVGYEHIADPIAAGQGVILALPHMGNWDFAGAWLANRGHKPLAVAEPVEPPELFDWFVEQRRRIGIDIVGLGPDAALAAFNALRDVKAVCLLCDRDLTRDGVPVDFFGERTTIPAGPAMLALRAGAPLVPVGTFFLPRGRHRLVIGPPAPTEREGRFRDDVSRITQLLAYRFEALIRQAPEQWHLLQPNWPSDLEAAGNGARGAPSCG